MRKIMAVFLAAVLFLDAASLFAIFYTKAKNLSDENTYGVYSKTTVAALGNNLISNEINTQAKDRITGESNYDYSFLYEGVKKELSDVDVTLMTQESVISSDYSVTGGDKLNASEALGDALVNLGVSAVNIATEHIFDFGEKGLTDTLNYWKGMGVATLGVYENSKAAKEPVIIESNGFKIGLVAFTEKNIRTKLHGSKIEIIQSNYETQIKELIEATKKESDIIVVIASWGDEYSSVVTDSQKKMAQNLSDWGADVIVGTYPRVLQKMEYITRADGTQTLVAYSLGNLLCSQGDPENLVGGILEFDIVREKKDSVPKIENIRVKGVVTHYGDEMSNIRVCLLDTYTDEQATAHGINTKTDEWTIANLKSILENSISREFLR